MVAALIRIPWLVYLAAPSCLWAQQWDTEGIGPSSGRHIQSVEYSVFSTVEPGVQCGLYSVLAAAQALNRSLPVEELVDGKWFMVQEGLSASDLAQIIRHFGFHPASGCRLSMVSLTMLDTPVLLLLDDIRTQGQPVHWVTFLGTQDDHPVIYDTHGGLRAMTWEELALRWGGTGVVVSNSRMVVLNVWLYQLLEAIWRYTPAIIFSLGVALLNRSSPYVSWYLFLCCRYCALPLFVLGWVGIELWSRPFCTFGNKDLAVAVRCTISASGGADRTIEQVAVEDVTDSVFIDARFPQAYEWGHLPGAVNVPVNTSMFDVPRKLGYLDPKTAVIVYCQNSKCAWADQLALRLNCLGYQARVLCGGVEGWTNHGRRLVRGPTP